jgi:acetyl esterase
MPEARRRTPPAALTLAREWSLPVQSAMSSLLLAQPASRLRRLAGRPVRIDGNELSVQPQLMLRLMSLIGERGAEEYDDVAAGRAAMSRQARMAGGTLPIGEVHERTVRGAAGPLSARLYVPRGLTGTGPLLVFFHGGGMVYGDLDTHEGLCRFLAESAGVRVLSVDYRLAPEHVFPAGVDDAWAAFEWVASNAADYDADPARLAVGGDSAGGYLAAATALRAAQEQVPLAFQLLIYPMTEMFSSLPSRSRFGEGFYLTAGFMDRAESLYLAGADPRDPRASVLHADLPPKVVKHLAPGYLVTAGFDPLRDEGEAYADKLQEAGVRLEYRLAAGEIHGFANMVGWPGPALNELSRAARALEAGVQFH